MEIRVLRYFLETAREGSVTRAARRLHISQPTLSKQLKDLEAELGKKLFVRSSFSVRLTDEGMLLRKRAEDILEMVDRTTEEFKALGEITGGDVPIGCAESENIRYLAQCVKAVQEQVPDIRIHLYSGDTNDLAERLDRGLLDFAVIAEAVDLSKYNYLELPGADTWGVVMRKDAPLAQKEAVRIDDLLELPLIVSRQGLREDIPKLFGETLDRLHITATLNLTYNGSILAREGLGYVLTFDKLTDTGEQSELCFRPLTPALTTKLYVIWKKYQVFSPAAELLLNELKARYRLVYEG
ncbi:MAG: LysR family transcriptional regulator [bacterium]|nr:LysR family transcriptional regulator [bacterium]